MTSSSESGAQRSRSPTPRFVGGILALVSVVAPFAILVVLSQSDPRLRIFTMLGQIVFGQWGYQIYFESLILILALFFTFLRIFFVLMMVRLYQWKTTKKRTLLVGIAGELQFVTIFHLIQLSSMIMYSMPFDSLQILLPTPILLFVGFIIIHFYPPVKTTTWIEETGSETWWDKSPEERTEEFKPNDEKTDQK